MNELISVELALLAKEKGLEMEMDDYGNIPGYSLTNIGIFPSQYKAFYNFPTDEEWLFAPTPAYLQKWLREEHDIDIVIIPDICYSYGKVYDAMIYTVGKKEAKVGMSSFKKYEDALEQSLLKALELI